MKTTTTWKPGHQTNQCMLLKVTVIILATAFGIGVFLYRPTTGFPPQLHKLTSSSHDAFVGPPFVPNTTISSPELLNQLPADDTVAKPENIIDEPPSKEKCDLFTGEWVPNPAGPVYTNDTCNLIEEEQNCMKNGRPDSAYLYWKWSPKNCVLPQFDAMNFLEMMRNKTWALIGDSITRNHMQSLLCILSKVEQPVFIYHDEEYKSKGWHFQSYDLKIYRFWSPFLVEAADFEDKNGVSSRDIDLYLDKFDTKWTDVIKDMDYMIFSTGKWFLKTALYYENNTVIGCHGCTKENITELGFEFAYRKSLRSVLNYIATSQNKGLIFFRTSTPDHFEDGEYWSGGKCNRTIPFKVGEIEVKDLHMMLRRIELEEFENATEIASQNGVRLRLLDFVQLSLLRPDGHPGPYRQFYPFAKDKNAKVVTDCLHWCLPGPIDSWNDVIMEMIVKG